MNCDTDASWLKSCIDNMLNWRVGSLHKLEQEQLNGGDVEVEENLQDQLNDHLHLN